MVHDARAHAKLSPSGASRWMACPGSIRLSEGIPDTSSVYADEGTAAHEIAERALREGKPVAFYRNSQVQVRDRLFTVDDEMADNVQVYVDHVRGLMAKTDGSLEERFDLQHIAPGMFGTGDFVGYSETEKALYVSDLKYGRGKAVEVENNPQLILYGLGALKRHHNRPISKLVLTIVQPRADHPDGSVRSFEIDPFDLLEWEADLVEAAKRTTEPEAPLKAGKHCTFCKAAPTCPAREEKALTDAEAEFDGVGQVHLPVVTSLGADKLGEKLKLVDEIEDWCRRVRDFAHIEAEHGRVPTGWKLVAKRANRKWRDEAQAVASLADYGVPEDDLWEKKFVSPAKAEKLLGKRKGVLDELVTKESSGTVLAPLSDSRPAVQAVDASTEFEAVN